MTLLRLYTGSNMFLPWLLQVLSVFTGVKQIKIKKRLIIGHQTCISHTKIGFPWEPKFYRSHLVQQSPLMTNLCSP